MTSSSQVPGANAARLRRSPARHTLAARPADRRRGGACFAGPIVMRIAGSHTGPPRHRRRARPDSQTRGRSNLSRRPILTRAQTDTQSLETPRHFPSTREGARKWMIFCGASCERRRRRSEPGGGPCNECPRTAGRQHRFVEQARVEQREYRPVLLRAVTDCAEKRDMCREISSCLESRLPF